MSGIRVRVDVDTRGVRRAVERVRRGGEQGVREAAEHVLDVAGPLVPYDEGPLHDSGEVDVDGMEATVSYDTEYAVIQHEEEEYRHAPGEQAKYLEEPFEAEVDAVQDIIAAAIDRELR